MAENDVNTQNHNTDANSQELSKTEIFVTVRDTETIHFEGKAISLSTANPYGYFDILPRHKNFITNIEEKIIIHISPTEKKEIPVDSGILRVFNNNVEIFLGIHTIDIESIMVD